MLPTELMLRSWWLPCRGQGLALDFLACIDPCKLKVLWGVSFLLIK